MSIDKKLLKLDKKTRRKTKSFINKKLFQLYEETKRKINHFIALQEMKNL